jgi:putative sigma-54 modulation protein
MSQGAKTSASQEFDIHVFGRNVQVTEAMKAYAIEKVSKIEKFSVRNVSATVTMDVQRGDQKIDIIMNVNNTRIKVHAINKDMYASIDKAVDRLKEKLRRYMERIHEHHAKGVKDSPINVSVVRPSDDYLAEINEEIEFENQTRIIEELRPHEIVSREKQSLKILSQKEAILKMELSRDVFLVYRAEEDQKLKVIYRRNDGNFGIIEPES